MGAGFELEGPLPEASFGGVLRLVGGAGAKAVVEAAEAAPEALPRALGDSRGLLLIQGMAGMVEEPALLLRLSRLFGPEIEDYRETLTPIEMVHPTISEIFIVSNTPPSSRLPPALPSP